jgi:hypothetical protein
LGNNQHVDGSPAGAAQILPSTRDLAAAFRQSEQTRLGEWFDRNWGYGDRVSIDYGRAMPARQWRNPFT